MLIRGREQIPGLGFTSAFLQMLQMDDRVRIARASIHIDTQPEIIKRLPLTRVRSLSGAAGIRWHSENLEDTPALSLHTSLRGETPCLLGASVRCCVAPLGALSTLCCFPTTPEDIKKGGPLRSRLDIQHE